MSKRLFAVILDADCTNKDLIYTRLEEKFPHVYKHADTFILVAGSPGVMTRDVAKISGIKSQHRSGESGVVLKLNRGYSGYTNKALWEWMSDVTENE